METDPTLRTIWSRLHTYLLLLDVLLCYKFYKHCRIFSLLFLCFSLQICGENILRFFIRHTVRNLSNVCDLNLNNVSIFKITRVLHTHSDPCRSSSHNDGSLFQSCTLRNEGDNFRDMEKKIACIC